MKEKRKRISKEWIGMIESVMAVCFLIYSLLGAMGYVSGGGDLISFLMGIAIGVMLSRIIIKWFTPARKESEIQISLNNEEEASSYLTDEEQEMLKDVMAQIIERDKDRK